MVCNSSQRLRWMLGIGALCLGGQVATARADLHLSIGSRIEPLRYTPAYFPYSKADRPPSLFGAATGPYQSTSLSPYAALFFSQKYSVMVSLDIGYAKSSGETQAMGVSPALMDTNSFFQFGLGLGTKIYLTAPKANKVSPYVYVDFYKYFASITTTDTTVTGELAGARAGLLSPVGGTVAFGAEYFFSPSFSIGTEILGLKLGYVSGEYRDSNQTRNSASYTTLAIYTGITLNYRFQISGAGKSGDDEPGEPARKPSAPMGAPPVANPPPVPTPEAVD